MKLFRRDGREFDVVAAVSKINGKFLGMIICGGSILGKTEPIYENVDDALDGAFALAKSL